MNHGTRGALDVLGAHFEVLYSRVDDFDDALQALLPASLAEQQVLSLKSTAFLSVPGLQRLEEICTATAARLGSDGNARRVLDVGCGRGRLGVHLARLLDGALVGIDLADSAVRSAKSELGRGATFLRGNFLCLPFAVASFDIVLAIDCLHLSIDVPSTLAEIRRVLTIGGILIASAYRLGHSVAADRTSEWWKACLTQGGFVAQQWTDVTTEWRHEMAAKHRKRWDEASSY